MYFKVKQGLGLKYNEPTEAIIEATGALNKIYSEPKTEPGDQEDLNVYMRCIQLIQSRANRYKSLFEGGANEFVTKLLFSKYSEEHIQMHYDVNIQRHVINSEYDVREMFSTTIDKWVKQNFQIPRIDYTANRSTEDDPREDWKRFDLPFFIRVEAEQRDKIISDHHQLLNIIE